MTGGDPKFAPFAPRAIRFRGVIDAREFRLKAYSIVFGGGALDEARFDPGLLLATRELPSPAASAGRPGVGFVVLHQGKTGDYVVLGWWDQENELPPRVFVRDGLAWRAARERESVCVWDLEVLWHERNAYVDTMLAPGVASPADAYLANEMSVARAPAKASRPRRSAGAARSRGAARGRR